MNPPTPPSLPVVARIAQAHRPWRVLLGVLVVAVCYLAFTPNPPPQISTGWDKLNHALAFTAVTFAARLSFPKQGWGALLVMLAALAFGGLIEVVQSQVPGRSSEWEDLLADSVGIAVGAVMAWPLLRAAARR